jgi:hypothetical protein
LKGSKILDFGKIFPKNLRIHISGTKMQMRAETNLFYFLILGFWMFYPSKIS